MPRKVTAAIVVVLVAVLALVGAQSIRADPPVFSNVPTSATVEATSTAGASFTYTDPTATDTVDGPAVVSCVPASGSVFQFGTTTVDCTATDASSITNAVSFTVTVADTTPPAVTPPAGVSVEATGALTPATFGAATAADTVDGALTPTCTPASPFPVGVTTVTCTASDNAHNQGSATFTVTVADTTAPVLSVTTPAPAEATGQSGAAVSISATATDLVDGAVLVACTPASGSTFVVGATPVTCTATDHLGNASSTPLTVVVTDTTAPQVNVPTSPMSVPATDPSGADVTYAASGADIVDGSLPASCPAHPSGSHFPIGSTTVTCTSTDAHNNTGSATFVVNVADTTPPAFSGVPGTLTYEANSSSGSNPNYTPPVAVDAVDGPVVVHCTPAPGATFQLGLTTVTCTAADALGNTGVATFTVAVVDTTAPLLTVPAPLTFGIAGDSLPASTPAIAAFLGSAVAHDIVDPSPIVSNNAPGNFPLGTTSVTFSAHDASGNTSSRTVTVTLTQAPPGTTPPPPPPPPDRTPPDNVSGVTVSGAGGRVTLKWAAPSATDFDHVEITRGDSRGGSSSQVYSGDDTSFVDAGGKPGTEYRYVITAFDHDGNASVGVALLVKQAAAVLLAPLAGSRVTKAPILAWASVAGATYYNVQIFRDGRKVLSLWPQTTRVQLPKKWRFAGHKYALGGGSYQWYVWPGFGARSEKRYGGVLGESTFSVR